MEVNYIKKNTKKRKYKSNNSCSVFGCAARACEGVSLHSFPTATICLHLSLSPALHEQVAFSIKFPIFQ